VLDVEIEVEVVRAVVVDAVVCAGDEIDVIKDVFSPLVVIAELRLSADVSLWTTSFSISCALTRVMTTNKRKNIRKTCVRARASMISEVCDRSHKFCRCLEKI
jgi:hypothetical protein